MFLKIKLYNISHVFFFFLKKISLHTLLHCRAETLRPFSAVEVDSNISGTIWDRSCKTCLNLK